MENLSRRSMVVGVKQTRRALASGRAKRIFLAKDADPALTGPLAELAQAQGVPVSWADSMKQLGRACSISVGAAAAVEI